MIIVTGASENHRLSLINFINSFLTHCNNSAELDTIIVYNLGIDVKKWTELQTQFANYANIIYKIFDYSKYPEWFNINIEAGQYAWKPAIIYETAIIHEKANDIIIWMDAGNLITDGLEILRNFIRVNGIYSGISNGSINDWTHPKTIDFFKCQKTDVQNRNGACLGFNTNKNFVKEFIKNYYEFCSMKECICPEGSSRENHRQDQSVFTILFYYYKCIYKYDELNDIDELLLTYSGYTIHNDV
jgi:hypothetical protein